MRPASSAPAATALAVGVAVGRWAVSFLVFLSAVAVGVFCLQLLIPGDPAERLLSSQLAERPSPAAVAAKRHELGLDQPFFARLGHWLSGLSHGDFGRSWANPGEVADFVWPRIGATLVLGGMALLASLVLAVAAGIGSALLRGRLADGALRIVVAVIACVPPFVIGVVVIEFVIVRAGIGHVLADGSLTSALLPAAVLTLGYAAVWQRPLRAIAVDVLDSPVVRTARARGASWPATIRAHVLPHVLLRFLPFIGIGFGSLLGATIVVEAVFSWNGIGPYAAVAAQHRDLPVLQAVALLSVVAYRLSTDLSWGVGWLLDPRRRSRAS